MAKNPETAPVAPAALDVQALIADALKAAGIQADVTRSTGVHDDVYIVKIAKDNA